MIVANFGQILSVPNMHCTTGNGLLQKVVFHSVQLIVLQNLYFALMILLFLSLKCNSFLEVHSNVINLL